ncbi:MAG: M28 family peptidase [Actinomycetota bacterium]|nr:M28 family peptidase [Actinomycetota bacterium]
MASGALRRVAAVGLVVILGASAPAPVGAKKSRYFDLDNAPKTKITGDQIIKGLENFVERFPMRQQGTPTNIAAARFLARESKQYGFKSRILKFQVGSPSRTARVVEAVKRGSKRPNEYIALVAHYDVVPGIGATVQGAYDDGSGTNMMRYFARAFSKIKLKRSLVLLWFDAEENGLLASEAYAARAREKGVDYKAVLGFDMVGVGHPAPYCICVYHGQRVEDAAIALPIIDHVNFDYLDFPKGDGGDAVTEYWPFGQRGHVCSCGPNIRNSDEQSFGAEGYFTMRWAGMRRARNYPGYHQPWDTVEMMETVAGSRSNLERGTENTFKSAYYTIFVLDRL